ncbi:MAG: SDR family NAD(P)-dependent oxidoreductase [Pseudomonadales bacterium]
MQDLAGRIAVVTGGGSGIGKALAMAFANQGMHVVISDIDRAAAEAAAGEVQAIGVKALAVETDVVNPDSITELADAVYAEFGNAHIICNNAGVVTFKLAQDMTDVDWDWVLDVDLYGVIYGVLEFLPRMLASGEPGHFVNTASIAGVIPGVTPGIIAYTAAKHGVVGLSEAMQLDLADTDIDVTVVCPGGVATRIADAERNRQARYGGPATLEPIPGDNTPHDILQPDQMAQHVLAAIRDKRLYVLSHPDLQPPLEARYERLFASIDAFASVDPRKESNRS